MARVAINLTALRRDALGLAAAKGPLAMEKISVLTQQAYISAIIAMSSTREESLGVLHIAANMNCSSKEANFHWNLAGSDQHAIETGRVRLPSHSSSLNSHHFLEMEMRRF